MIRNTHKVGDYLAVDDESGIVHYASEMVFRWDGAWVHKSNFEARHPQEFVKAGNDPKALRHVRPDAAYPRAENVLPQFIGETEIAFPSGGPAGHLFGGTGVGEMIVEDDIQPFVVA